MWSEALVFGAVFSAIILIPCILIALMGRKMIYKLAYYPSRAPEILMSICFQFIILAVISLSALIGFYHFFSMG